MELQWEDEGSTSFPGAVNRDSVSCALHEATCAGVIWASFLGQLSEKEHLVWDVCRCAVMAKLLLSNKTDSLRQQKEWIYNPIKLHRCFQSGHARHSQDHILGENCSYNKKITWFSKLSPFQPSTEPCWLYANCFRACKIAQLNPWWFTS